MPLIPPIGKLPRAFWYLWLGMLVNRLGSFLYLILPYYLPGKHQFTVQEVAWVASMHNIGAIFSGPAGGFLADVLERRKALLFSTFWAALAMLQLGLANAHWHIALSAFLLGFLGNLYRPSSQAMVADLVPIEERSYAYGWMYWASNLGFAGAAMIAGFLAEKSYMALFVLDAVTTLGFGFFIFFIVSPKTKIPKEVKLKQEKPSFLRPYLDLVFLTFLGIQFLIDFLYHQADVALPSDMSNQGFSQKTFGWVISINGFLIILVQPFLLQGVRNFRRSFVLALGALLIGIGFSLIGLAKGTSMYAVSVCVWTLGEILCFSMVPPLISDLSSEKERAGYQGAYQFAISLAACAAPPIGAYLTKHFGRNGFWLTCLGIGVVAAILHLLIAPARLRKLIRMHGEKEARKREEGRGI